MKRWNGWGNPETEYPLKDSSRKFLADTLGEATPLASASLESVVQSVPETRLQEHPLINTDKEIRVRHARGQSFPDWLAMRSGNFGVFPDGVAQPESIADIRTLLEHAVAHDIDVIPYGGGTSVVGHINPEQSEKAVLTLSLEKMNKLLAIDHDSHIATFEPGATGPQVEEQLKAEGYTLGHFPQSWEISTLGGWVASRSSGQQSLRYGRIENMYAGGRVETAAGTLEIPTIPASSCGPDIRQMILGSEGRMGIISEVKVRVVPLAEKEQFKVVFMPTWEAGVEAAKALAQQKVPLSMVRVSNPTETFTHLQLAAHPAAIKALDGALSLRGAKDQKCMLTYGLTGSPADCRFANSRARKILKQHGGVNTGQLLGKKWEHSRFRSPYLRHGLWEHGYGVDTLETACDWSKTNDMMHGIESAISEANASFGEKVHVFTHLSHVYNQGSSVYTTYIFKLADSYEETERRWQIIKQAASEAIVKHGGTISHQHGVGVDHAPYLEAEKSAMGIGAIQELCEYFDPSNNLNPGKLVPAKTKS